MRVVLVVLLLALPAWATPIHPNGLMRLADEIYDSDIRHVETLEWDGTEVSHWRPEYLPHWASPPVVEEEGLWEVLQRCVSVTGEELPLVPNVDIELPGVSDKVFWEYNASEVQESVKAGRAALGLHHADTRFQALHDMCHTIEEGVGCPCSASVWFSRPETQGRRVHVAAHDKFVLQVLGHKSWWTHGVADAPAKGWRTVSETSRTQLRTLRQGDVLFIPRGVVHEAVALDTPSLHLTVQISCIEHRLTWAELLHRSLSRLAQTSSALHTTPPHLSPPSSLPGVTVELQWEAVLHLLLHSVATSEPSLHHSLPGLVGAEASWDWVASNFADRILTVLAEVPRTASRDLVSRAGDEDRARVWVMSGVHVFGDSGQIVPVEVRGSEVDSVMTCLRHYLSDVVAVHYVPGATNFRHLPGAAKGLWDRWALFLEAAPQLIKDTAPVMAASHSKRLQEMQRRRESRLQAHLNPV